VWLLSEETNKSIMSSFTGETKTASTGETKSSPTTPSLEWVRLADQSNAFSLTNNCLPWNYPHPNDNQHIVTITSITSSMILLQPELIPKEYKKIHGITRRSFTGGTKNLWLRIYSYLQPSYFTRLSMKWSCRLFNEVEKMITFNPNCSPLEPIPLYTSFPHPNYASLRGLTTCLNALSKMEPDNVPSLLLIADGIHDEQGEYVVIDFPLTIVGESKEGCTIVGGLMMKGKKEDDVNVKNLTISQSKRNGVDGEEGMSFHLFHLNIEKSEVFGVCVSVTKRNTMSNCQVSHSKRCGVYLENGLITVKGSGTSIHNNVTGGNSMWYGLYTSHSSSIHLVSPLTKENISINNGGGGNYGGNGTIKTIRTKEEVLRGVDAEGTLHVKPGLNSLSNAVIEANVYNIKEIFLKNGVHDEKGKVVDIDCPITIIGETKDGCTIVGGLSMTGKKEDDVNVKHLTISQSKGHAGVFGDGGMSFHLFHLKIEKSGRHGVFVYDTKRNTMSNCQVSHSIGSGVFVNGLLTMNGSGTSIHKNVTGGNSTSYGLKTYSYSCSIHLVSPLTKESVSINNNGGGNYGGNGLIAIVDNEGTIVTTIQEVSDDY